MIPFNVERINITFIGAIFSHDDSHRRNNLLGNRRWHGIGVAGCVAVDSQMIDELLLDKKKTKEKKIKHEHMPRSKTSRHLLTREPAM